MTRYPHTFTATLPITFDRDGDAQLPKSFSAILKKCEHPCGAHFSESVARARSQSSSKTKMIIFEP